MWKVFGTIIVILVVAVAVAMLYPLGYEKYIVDCQNNGNLRLVADDAYGLKTDIHIKDIIQ